MSDSWSASLVDLTVEVMLGAAFSFPFPFLSAIFIFVKISFYDLEAGCLRMACRVRRPTGSAPWAWPTPSFTPSSDLMEESDSH